MFKLDNYGKNERKILFKDIKYSLIEIKKLSLKTPPTGIYEISQYMKWYHDNECSVRNKAKLMLQLGWITDIQYERLLKIINNHLEMYSLSSIFTKWIEQQEEDEFKKLRVDAVEKAIFLNNISKEERERIAKKEEQMNERADRFKRIHKK